MRHRWKGAVGRALLIPWVLLAGCGGDDDKGTGPSQGVDQGTAQLQAEAALLLVDGMVANIDNVANADFAGLGAPPAPGLRQIQWDPSVSGWKYSFDVPGEGSSLSWNYLVQYLSGGVPITDGQNVAADAAAADGMRFQLSYVADTHTEHEGTVAEIHITYENTMDVAGLNARAGVLDVSGTGSMDVDYSQSGQQTFEYAFSMSWGMDLDVPDDGGCATGSVTVTVENWTVTATYNAGSGQYTWQMTEAGQVVGSGTGIAGCTAG